MLNKDEPKGKSIMFKINQSNLKSLLNHQLENNFDVYLTYQNTELTKKEIQELMNVVRDTGNYGDVQNISTDSNWVITATHKNNFED